VTHQYFCAIFILVWIESVCGWLTGSMRRSV